MGQKKQLGKAKKTKSRSYKKSKKATRWFKQAKRDAEIENDITEVKLKNKGHRPRPRA